MTKDIVERLYDEADAYDADASGNEDRERLLREAADLIKRLMKDLREEIKESNHGNVYIKHY